MTKRKKDPVYDPDARLYLMDISNERASYSNPGSKFRELVVCIGDTNTQQSGHSYVDVKMENYKKVGWPDMTTIMQLGYVLTGKGVLGKNYKTDEIDYDADHIHELELVEDEQPVSTHNNFSTVYK